MSSEPKPASSKRTFTFGRCILFGAAASAVMVAVACGSDEDPGATGSPDAAADSAKPTPPSSGFDAGAGEAKAPLD